MSLLKRNLVANFFGHAWTAIISLAFVPLYIHFLGMEAYGLIGVFATLQAIFALMDLGLSTTLSRELSRRSADPSQAQESRDLVRTLELVYWGLAVTAGLGIMLAAPLIAHHWVRNEHLPAEIIQQAVLLMGLATALRLPGGFYAGGLMGLQRQVLLNGLNSVLVTVRGVGAVFVLWWVAPTIQAFFLWQVVLIAMQTILTMTFLWRRLPVAPAPARFRRVLLRQVARFTAGISGITVLALGLTQLDKVILSRLLPLETFGYYTLAGAVALSLSRLVSPVYNSIQPRLTQLLSQGDEEALKQTYHRSSQLMAVLLLPAATVVAMFSYDIMHLWTQNAATAEQTHLLVSILVVGTALNGLMNTPYALQLAAGWTRLTFYANAVMVLALTPLTLFLTTRFGVVGGASVWVIVNSVYLLVVTPLMHRRLLPRELTAWYLDDILRPWLPALAVAASVRWLLPSLPPLPTLLALGATLLAAWVASALSVPYIRTWASRRVNKCDVTYEH